VVLGQTKDGVFTTYTHDAANAVLSATSGASVTTYSYDASGNRILTVVD
jgi:YD repeat-containing protein